MKKLQSIIVCITVLVCLTGCGIDFYNLEKVSLENYESITFYELLTRYIEEQIDEEYDEHTNVEYEIVYEEGWEATDHLNENVLNDDETAVTYSIILKAATIERVERINIKFFVILHEEEYILSARGLYFDENGDVDEFYSKNDIDYIFREIFDELV